MLQIIVWMLAVQIVLMGIIVFQIGIAMIREDRTIALQFGTLIMVVSFVMAILFVALVRG